MLGRRVPAPVVSEGHPLGTGKHFILRRPAYMGTGTQSPSAFFAWAIR